MIAISVAVVSISGGSIPAAIVVVRDQRTTSKRIMSFSLAGFTVNCAALRALRIGLLSVIADRRSDISDVAINHTYPLDMLELSQAAYAKSAKANGQEVLALRAVFDDYGRPPVRRLKMAEDADVSETVTRLLAGQDFADTGTFHDKVGTV